MAIGEFARLSRLSAKALRLYDELDLLVPAQVDADTGYRWYATEQLDAARLVASLRQLGMPLAQIKEIVSMPSATAAELLRSYWRAAECEHAAQRQLAAYLVDQLNGMRPVMYEVGVRDIPARSVLCLLRSVADEDAVFALGKEFIGILRRSALPAVDGAAGATFLIYHGEVSADSDGPVEMCRPVPADTAAELAAQVPELTLRTEPAHQEAFVSLGRGPASRSQWQLAIQSLQDWAAVQHRLPSPLGVRITFQVTQPITADSAPDCDFAMPLARQGAAA